ncbi:MAG: MerR family transcriptional regulator [Chloroflexi bacterium]|nr:MerR family transcriptional regulator [Chloroflexota bacterium]
MTTGRRPTEVAKELGVSTSTLRRWSLHFSDYLSSEAGHPVTASLEDIGQGHRRYSNEDVGVLIELQGMLQEGKSFDEARILLDINNGNGDASEEGDEPALAATDSEAEDESALVHQPEEEDGVDVARMVAATLSSLSDSQQIILSSQQTERQLLGVLLQDNFNLKEENVRIRERMIDTERQVFEMKRSLESTRSSERERMRQMEAQLFELQKRLDAMSHQRAATQQTPVQPSPAPIPIVAHEPAAVQTQPAPAQITAGGETAINETAVDTTQDATMSSTMETTVQGQNNESPPPKRGFWQRLWGR